VTVYEVLLMKDGWPVTTLRCQGWPKFPIRRVIVPKVTISGYEPDAPLKDPGHQWEEYELVSPHTHTRYLIAEYRRTE